MTGGTAAYELTRRNGPEKYIHEIVRPRMSASEFDDYDMCLVFPLSIPHGDRVLTGDQIVSILSNVLRARVGGNVDDLNSSINFHPVYELAPLGNSMTLSGLHQIIQKAAFNVLKHIRADYSVERIKSDFMFVRCRLREEGAKELAGLLKYPLQAARETCPYDEYMNDYEYHAPYVPYDDNIEASLKKAIFTRYDKLSRPLRMLMPYPPMGAGGYKNANADDYLRAIEHGSLFRDIDRTRLLYYGLFEFLNLELLCEKYNLMHDWFCLKQPCVERCLIEPDLTADSASLYDWKNYFGEYITLHTLSLSFFTKSVMYAAAFYIAVYLAHLFAPEVRTEWKHHHIPVMGLLYSSFSVVWTCITVCLWIRHERLASLRWGQLNSTMTKSIEDCPYFKEKKFSSDPDRSNHYVRENGTAGHATRIVCTSLISFMLLGFTCSGFVYVFQSVVNEVSSEKAGVHVRWLNYMQWSAIYIVLIAKASAYLFEGCIVRPMVKFENHLSLCDMKKSADLKVFIYRVVLNISTVVCLWRMTLYYDDVHQDHVAVQQLKHSIGLQIILLQCVDLLFRYGKIALLSFRGAVQARRGKSTMNNKQFREYLMEEYLRLTETIPLDKTIEFANVAMFSVAAPCLPLMALVSGLIDIRLNYFILRRCRKPYPQGSGGSLGTAMTAESYHNDLLKSIQFVAILTNVAYCMLSTPTHETTITSKLVSILIFLVMGVGIKDLIEYKLPQASPQYNLLMSQMELHLHESLWSKA